MRQSSAREATAGATVAILDCESGHLLIWSSFCSNDSLAQWISNDQMTN
jgi:hypothetical protein